MDDIDIPVTLITREKARWRAASTGGGAAPEDLVRLFLPGDLHVVNIVDTLVGGVPAVRIALRRRIVVMARNENVAVSSGFGRGEHRVERREGPRIGEEVALVVVSPRVLAKVKLVVDGRRKVEVLIHRRGCDASSGEEVDRLRLALLERRSDRGEQATRLTGRVACPTESLPNRAAVAAPVGGVLAANDGGKAAWTTRIRDEGQTQAAAAWRQTYAMSQP